MPGPIVVGPDGNLWFGETGRIGRISAEGQIAELDIPATPYQMTVGADGNLWFTDCIDGKIRRVTLAGVFTAFTLSVPDPYLTGITTGPDGDIWFSFYGADLPYGQIGRMTTGGAITEYPESTIDGLYADYLRFDKHGNLWFPCGSNSADDVCRRDTNGTLTRFSPPTSESGPFSTIVGPDGNLWFLEAAVGKIARLVINP